MTTRISPLAYRKIDKTPIAYMDDYGAISGERNARIVYSVSPLPPLRLIRKRGGVGTFSRTAGAIRWIRFEIDGKTFYPGITTRSIDQLISFRDYCHGIGIPARSIQAMSFDVMRNTLGGYFDCADGSEIPFFMLPTGARMHAKPGVYRGVYQSDITAAYLWGIGRFTPAKSFVSRPIRAKDLVRYPGSFALAQFRNNLPRRTFGPLPYISSGGTTVFPTGKDWSSLTLLSERDIYCGLCMGTEFRLRKAWIAEPGIFQPFSPFMWEVWRMRESSAFPDVAKQVGNTLWGSFVASGKLNKAVFTPGKTNLVTPIPPRAQLCAPIGYSVLGELRSRLYMEGISSGTVHAHTDGVIGPRPLGSDNREPGEWRTTEHLQEVEVLTPSWYRTVDDMGEIHYKIAGRPETGDQAAAIFSKFRERRYPVFK